MWVRRSSHRASALAVWVAVTLSACAAPAGSVGADSGGSAEGGAEGAGVVPNSIGGTRVASLADAKGSLLFDPIGPKGLGEPTGVFVTPPEETGKSFAIELDYQVPGLGLIVVRESPPMMPASSWPDQVAAHVDSNGEPLVHGTSSSAIVRGDHLALLTVPEDGSTAYLSWYERDDLLLTVTGERLTPESLLKLVESL